MDGVVFCGKKGDGKEGRCLYFPDFGYKEIMNRFGIIQLSDLQFGEKHRFGKPSKIAEKLLNDINEMSVEYGFTPSYIVLSGDITEEAHAEEFSDAVSVLEEILSDLKIDRNNILIIPGNHDVNWNLSDLSQEAGDDQLKFLPYDKFVSTITDNNNDYSVSDCYPNMTYKQSGVTLEFLLLNSCETEGRTKHNGYVCPDKLKKTLPSQVPGNYEKLKIAILHHRLDALVYDKRDAIENARDIYSIITSHKYNIVLTGHVHRGVYSKVTNNTKHNIIFAGCGSTGANYRQREDGVQNQYCIHVIDLDTKKFQSIWRAYNPLRETGNGEGGWTKDNSFDDEPFIFDLPNIKPDETISLQAKGVADISKFTIANEIEKRLLDMTDIDWDKPEFAEYRKFLISLGVRDE